MAISFRSGSYAIPTGTAEFTISGLSLGFTPTSVNVSVRQPSDSTADIISGFVAGTPTADGFSVVLTAPAAIEGYKLDWTATKADSVQPISGDTLAVSYADLKNEVSRFLGYDPTALTTVQQLEVDNYIQSGIRQFYYPPAMEGVDTAHEWSFIRQNGSLSTTANEASYLLPDGFGRIAGQLTYQGGVSLMGVPVIPYGEMRKLLDSRGELRGIPRFASTLAQSEYGARGQRKRIYLFPIPDAAYTLDFVCDSDTGKIDAETRPFPLGGALYSELIIESCLSIAEQKANDEMGLHTQKFKEMLIAAIQRDSRSCGKEFGSYGDSGNFHW